MSARAEPVVLKLDGKLEVHAGAAAWAAGAMVVVPGALGRGTVDGVVTGATVVVDGNGRGARVDDEGGGGAVEGGMVPVA
jgi:hypothetical protein